MPTAPPLEMPSSEARSAIIKAARRMAAEGLVVGMVGNVSLRVGGTVLITPTRTRYERLERDRIAAIRIFDGDCEGEQQPSRETPLHLAVYRTRSDVQAIVHTHSPHATAWSFLEEPLRPTTEDNTYYEIGDVRVSPLAAAGSDSLAASATAALGDSAAVLLAGHGVLATGPDLDHALDVARAVEHQAQIAWLLRGAGVRRG